MPRDLPTLALQKTAAAKGRFAQHLSATSSGAVKTAAKARRVSLTEGDPSVQSAPMLSASSVAPCSITECPVPPSWHRCRHKVLRKVRQGGGPRLKDHGTNLHSENVCKDQALPHGQVHGCQAAEEMKNGLSFQLRSCGLAKGCTR